MYIKSLLLLLAAIAVISLGKKNGAKVVRVNAGTRGKIFLSNLRRRSRTRIIRCCGRNSCIVNKRRPNSKKNSTGSQIPATPSNTIKSSGGAEVGKGNANNPVSKQPLDEASDSGSKGPEVTDTATKNPEKADDVSKPPEETAAPEEATTPGETAAAATKPASTEAAAVGYTGKTAGADGDYGDDPAAATPKGGVTPSTSNFPSGPVSNNGSTPTTNSGFSPATINGSTLATNNGSASANNDSTVQSTTSQPVAGSQNTTQNANQNGTPPANNSSAPAAGGGGNGANATSGASGLSPPANMSLPANMTIPVNMTIPGNMTLPGNMTIPGNMTLPGNMTMPDDMPALSGDTSDGGDTAGGGKPASKDDDKNYDEKGIPPPADYVEPATPTEPNKATIRPKSNPCIDDRCVMPCEKESKYFPLGAKSVPGTKGSFGTACSKKYFFSNEKKTQEGAYKECCAIGMKLASIETREKQDCLIKYNKDTLKRWGLYWTTGSDKSCAKKYHWCTGTAVDVALMDWRHVQPNYLIYQHCLGIALRYGWQVLLKFWPADNGLNDKECWLETYYLCEE